MPVQATTVNLPNAFAFYAPAEYKHLDRLHPLREFLLFFGSAEQQRDMKRGKGMRQVVCARRCCRVEVGLKIKAAIDNFSVNVSVSDSYPLPKEFFV